MISVVIPANNEEGYIGTCLDLILASRGIRPNSENTTTVRTLPPLQVVVVANGCTDNTVAEARAREAAFIAQGWRLDVLDLETGNKIGALNAGDGAALHGSRVYIDADIHVSPDLLAQLDRALDRPDPAYAGGRPRIRPARSVLSERYARFWERLPFMARGVPGCGVYGVNAAGRARWNAFPVVIADDTFVRYHFDAHEMHGVSADYSWPITEGFASLVRVRRRQDRGLEEIRHLLPDRAGQMSPTAPDLREKMSLFLRDPVGFAIYSAVALAVRLPVLRNRAAWERGR